MQDLEQYPSLSQIGEFSKYDASITKYVESIIEIDMEELPILLCWISKESWALITTQRLASFRNGIVSKISAKECEGCWPEDARNPPIEKEGKISPHIAGTKDGKSIMIDLPSGSAAIAFQGAALVLSRLKL